jgi:2-C-methyl-D-erythritol 2,4-cyclodiphosphate synthase
MGYDIHRLADGRRLVLGGVTIPFHKGLLGHSDADVLIHAVCDALLGAAGLDDIGRHFPDSAAEFKDISSMILLEQTITMIHKKKFCVQNMDVTVLAEAPKIAPYREAIKNKLARVTKMNVSGINIKATTTEGLGMIGRGEGIGAMCVVLLQDRENDDSNL